MNTANKITEFTGHTSNIDNNKSSSLMRAHC